MKLCLGLLAITLAACASTEDATDDATANVSAGLDPALIGSWSIDDGTIDSLAVSHKPFRTVASLILRADGTYYAQLAPREVLSDPLLDESHLIGFADGLELTGAWRGAEGRWSTRATGGRHELVLTRAGDPDRINAAPALTLSYESGRSLAVTNDAYAGTQAGKTDKLVRRDGDCRTNVVVRAAREIEADKLAAEAFDCGLSPNAGVTKPGLEGEPLPAGACTEKIIESGLRGTRKSASGKLLATTHTFADLRSGTRSSQSYVYDAAGKLRVVITTTEDPDVPWTAEGNEWMFDRTRGDSKIAQTRTYFDENGAATRTLVQPHVEEARAPLPGASLYVGRRYESLQDPADILDLPWCASETPSLIAADPKNPTASLAAAPVCRASL